MRFAKMPFTFILWYMIYAFGKCPYPEWLKIFSHHTAVKGQGPNNGSSNGFDLGPSDQLSNTLISPYTFIKFRYKCLISNVSYPSPGVNFEKYWCGFFIYLKNVFAVVRRGKKTKSRFSYTMHGQTIEKQIKKPKLTTSQEQAVLTQYVTFCPT